MMPKRSAPARRWGRFWFLVTLMLLLSFSGGVVYYWHEYWPNSQRADFHFRDNAEQPIFYKGEQLPLSAMGEKEALKLPYAILKEWIDPAIYYEEDTQSVIITTDNKVVRLRTSQLTGMINEESFSLQFPVEAVDDIIFVPMEPLKGIYQTVVRESEETGAVILHRPGDVITWGVVKEETKNPERTRALRSDASVKAPIYADLPQGERVMIWGEENGWYNVQRTNGMMGFINKNELVLQEPEAIAVSEDQTAEFVPWKPLGGKINLTWQQVYNKNPDPTQFGSMPGLNVISPQWFMLADGDGNIQQTADAGFVQWAKNQNLQVWALFSNGFDPKRTSEALATYDKRMKIIKQMVSYVQLYKLQGINVDFENVYLKDKELFVQFMRELTPFLHEQGVVVSVDVTVKDGSETYSLFLDRRALGETVDYMMVMTYDEHWSTSPKAGSVASLPWVEKGIVKIMEEDDVPASKLLLGVPFYTRIWTEKVEDGKTSVSSRAVGMQSIENLLVEKNLTPVLDPASGQNYVEYKEDAQTTVKIWIEDEVSMRKRIELVNTYDLAGVASWSRGQEKEAIWPLIKEILEQKL